VSSITLKKGRDASVLRHHPWIFSGAIQKVTGNPERGEVVRVQSADGLFLGTGAWSPDSQIRVRIFSFVEISIDQAFLENTITAALAKRQQLRLDPQRNSYRLIYGESDGLPGLIVDRYDKFLVCQYLFAGVERLKDQLTDLLAKTTGCQGIYERSDASARTKEGLEKISGLLWGDMPSQEILVKENGMQLAVDVVHGQKTGYYLDQVDNRRHVLQHCKDRSVLNCFSYTGAFSVAALQGGASNVTSIDSSASALSLADANVRRNGFTANLHHCIEGSVFDLLREFHRNGQQFDIVILDPPKFAENKSQVMKAARAYKDLALQAVKLLPAGGLLVNFSCSGGIDLNLFQKITADAFLDARRQGEVLHYLHQSADHPIALGFPESQYLKGLICRVNDRGT
jgi:23S rRNA (cytosine1962-C5)-methyltransferase